MQDGATALHIAAARGFYELVKILVQAFANVNPPAEVCFCMVQSHISYIMVIVMDLVSE